MSDCCLLEQQQQYDQSNLTSMLSPFSILQTDNFPSNDSIPPKKNKMDTKAIDSLKFKAYLKAPLGGSARVELCTNDFGRLVVVKWTPETKGVSASNDIPGSLVYDCFAEREDGSFTQFLPTLLGLDSMKTQGGNMGRIVAEYCQGHDLEELVNYASLAGEGLPEAFLWHVIKLVSPSLQKILLTFFDRAFIEYCFALSSSYLDLTVFDPAHVLFTFDTPNYANTGDVAELQYPRVAFCGLAGMDDLDDTYDPGDPANLDVSCVDAIRAFAAYLWSHVEGIPACNDEPVIYSEALISWLRIMAGTDGGPPRYVDEHHLIMMLHTRIDEYRGPAKTLKLTPWLSRYFKQLRLESDTQYSAMTSLNRGSIRPEIDKYVEKVKGPHQVHSFSLMPPVISSSDDITSLTTNLTAYLDKATHIGITEEEWGIRRWLHGVTPMSLEDIREHLSEFMHKSLERSILLGQWSGIWMEPTQNISFRYLPRTRAIFDAVEPDIFKSLVGALARCQHVIAEKSRTELKDAVRANANQLNGVHRGSIQKIGRLLDEVQTCYQAAFNRAVWNGDRWRWFHREVRSTVQVRTSFLEWEKWFAIHTKGLAKALSFAQHPSVSKGERVEQFLRLELDLPPHTPLEKLAQDKIIARGDMANNWYKQKNGGHVYAIPEWKENSQEREQRHAKYEEFDEKMWTEYLKKIRENGTRAAKALHSPGDMSLTDPPSPKVRIAGKVEHAKNAEQEYRKLTNRPRLAPRRRQDISKAELRVYKIFKRWRRNFAFEHPWYTDANLWENFRQQFRRGSRDFEDIRTSFNRKALGTGGSYCQIHVRTASGALRHMAWYLNNRKPMKNVDDMSICSSASDPTLPVEEKPELWDVSDSSGTEDEAGRWISKRDKK